MNTNNEFLTIDSHSQYEVNVFGDVRKKHNKKLQTVIDGKVRIISDRTCKRTLRSVNAIVADAFYPDPEGKKRRDALVYYEGIGFRPKNNVSNDENLLQNLIVGNCDYKLRARKNYNNELTFWFEGKMNYDKDIICLLVNEKKDEYTLYDNWDDAEGAVCQMDGDEVYYLSVNTKRPIGVEGDALLEHLLMAKFYYIKAKVKEDDIECDLEQLKQKYLSYDFEERYDMYDAELVRLKHPEESEPKILISRVVKPKKLFEEQRVFTEEEKAQHEKERREENHERSKREIQRQYQMENKDRMRREKEEASEEKYGPGMLANAEGETVKAIRRYNAFFGTNFNNLGQMAKSFEYEVKRNRQRKEQLAEQDDKQTKTKQKKIKKYQDKIDELMN
jgi:hypothetical protein